MRKLLGQVQGGLLKLLVLAGFLLLMWGTLAPIGTLMWWLGQSAESLGLKRNLAKRSLSEQATRSRPTAKINCYIIYLPGVGDFSANQLTSGEEWLLEQLVQQHPNCVAVRDVFPYSAANQDLGGQRFLAPLWSAAEKADGWLENADVLIKIRNLWRFAISADNRYGPVYNQGIADAILDRMNAAHPLAQADRRSLHLVLLGTSGGAQVALGATPYLDQWLQARITMVSVGGTFDGAVGFEAAEHVYHLQGKQDWIEDISRVMFADRWPVTVASPFNQARQQGKYTVVDSGPQAHDGEQGYFGLAIAQPNTRYVDLTFQTINQLPIWSTQNPKKQE